MRFLLFADSPVTSGKAKRVRRYGSAVSRPLRILLSMPVYWPALSFGGPVEVMRRIAEGLAARGHTVGRVPVRYLATPVRFRWMGVTPTLPVHLERAPRPDVVHVFGFRDPV